MVLPWESHSGTGHRHPGASLTCLVPVPCASVPSPLSAPWSPVLAHPQLLLCPGVVDEGQGGAGVSGGSEPPPASQERGDTVQLQPQPDLSQQQRPTFPQQIAAGFVPAVGEVCPGPSEHHGGC